MRLELCSQSSECTKAEQLSVLVVEDAKLNRELIRLILQEEGHKVITTDSGETSLELLQHHHVDVVLLDIQLPGLSGIDVVKTIRSRERYGQSYVPAQSGKRTLQTKNTSLCKHLPVIAMTGHTSQEDRDLYMEHGMDGYILKPFDPEYLLAELKIIVTSIR